MITLDAHARRRIETALGRALTRDEHAPAASLAALSPASLAVARQLAGAQLALCVRYLLTIVASASARDVLLFTHRW
jgi:hypothetical protein